MAAQTDTAPKPSSTTELPDDFPPAVPDPAKTEPKAPPKRGPGRPRKNPEADAAPKAPPRPVGRPPKPKIKDQVAQAVESIGALMVVGGTIRNDPYLTYDGNVVVSRAPEIGEAVSDIADSNPAVKRALERMFTASGWGKIGLTVAQVAVPIMACHGIVPAAAAVPFVHPTVGLPPAPKPIEPAAKRAAPVRPSAPPAQAPASEGQVPDHVEAPVSDLPSSHPDMSGLGWPSDLDVPDPTPLDVRHYDEMP